MNSIKSQITSLSSRLTLLVTLSLALTSCAAGPKPAELQEFERLLAAPELPNYRKIEGTAKFMSEARQYERMADEAWNDGEKEDAKEYALLGSMRLMTARALYERSALQGEFANANQQVTDTNAKLEELSKKREVLRKEIADLQQKRNAALREARERETNLRTTKLKSRGTAAFAQSSAVGAATPQLTAKLNEAKEAQRKASAVNAAKFAPAVFNLANNRLSTLEQQVRNNTSTPSTQSELAQLIGDFTKAESIARPLFEAEQEKADPAARRRRIQSEAAGLSDQSTQVESHSGGVRIVMVGLFSGSGVSLDSFQERRLAPIIKLAQSFDDFRVKVVGYTSKNSDVTASLGTSQGRASSVARAFKKAGIKQSSIETAGEGQSDPRFEPATDRRNDRVEITFSR